MITQPNPHIEARPATPAVQHGPHIHLPRRSHLRPAPLETRATGTQPPNIALAGLQIIVGYEWLLAGGDKLLLGGFPDQLGKLLLPIVGGGQLLGFFASILRELVVPNAVLFGYLIEWGETLAGLGLVTAGLLALLRLLVECSLGGRSTAMFVSGLRLVERLAPLAALGAGLLGLAYFFLDGLPKPWFVPSIAFGGSIDRGLFMAAASVVLVVSQFVQRHQMRRISEKDAANTQGSSEKGSFLHTLSKHSGNPLGCTNFLVHPFAQRTFQTVSNVYLYFKQSTDNMGS